jgi:hypothetical protein
MTTVDNRTVSGATVADHVRIQRRWAVEPLTGAAGYQLPCSDEAEQDETRQQLMED